MIEKIEDPESSRFGEKGSRKPNKRKCGSNECGGFWFADKDT